MIKNKSHITLLIASMFMLLGCQAAPSIPSTITPFVATISPVPAVATDIQAPISTTILTAVPTSVAVLPTTTIQNPLAWPTPQSPISNPQSYITQLTATDNRYIAEARTEFSGKHNRNTLTITSPLSSKAWVAIARMDEASLGYSVITPIQWSANAKSLYFSESSIGDGCPLTSDAAGLWRADLISRKITKLALAKDTYGLSLSPSTQYIAYWASNGIEIQNLRNQQKHRALNNLNKFIVEQNKRYAYGGIIWSADEKWLYFTIGKPCVFGDKWNTRIIQVDIATGKSQQIYEGNEMMILYKALPDEDVILRNMATDELGEWRVHFWRFNLKTQKLVAN